MSFISAELLAEERGLTVAKVRRIARMGKVNRIKNKDIEMYDDAEFDGAMSSLAKPMKQRKLSESHLKKMLAGKKKG